MYPDLITPKSFPDLLQQLSYDPFNVMPAALPGRPRVLLPAEQLLRAGEHIAGTAWAKAGLRRLLGNCRNTGEIPATLDFPPQPALVKQLTFLAERNALAFHLTGEDEFGQRALSVFRLLARHYPQWPVVDGIRVMDEDLAEHRIAISMAETYDLLAMTPLSSEDEALFRAMLHAAIPLIDDCPHRACGNHHTSAILCRIAVGMALGDAQEIHDALYGCCRDGQWQYGLIHTLRHDILSDGAHWEGAPGYHFYTLMLLTDALALLQHAGVDLWHRALPAQMQDDGQDLHRAWGPRGMKCIKAAFDASFYMMFPNGDFSLLHDSRLANIRGAWIWGILYNQAWEAYGDPKYAWLLQRMEREYPPENRLFPDLPMPLNTERGDLDFVRLRDAVYPEGSFTFREDRTISLCGRHEHGCSLLPVTGRAVLRGSSDENGIGAMLYWGPHWAGHMNPASLHLDITAGGRRVTDAPRSCGYEDANHLTWNRTTIANNTVTVDDASMFPYDFATESIWETDRWRDSISDGQLELFQPGSDFSIVRAVNENVYPGVRLDRTVLVSGTYLLDVFRVLGEREHRYDWAMHCVGRIPFPANTAPCDLGQARGYRHLGGACRYPLTGHAATITWGDAPHQAHLCILPPPGADVILAHDPPISAESETLGEIGTPEPRTAVLTRAHGHSALFLSLWTFSDAAAVKLEHLSGDAVSDLVLIAHSKAGSTEWHLPFGAGPVILKRK